MTLNDWLRLVGNILIYWGTVAGVLAPVVYAFVPWWRSPLGRHLMIYMVMIGTTFLLLSIRILTGDTPWFAAMRFAVFAGVVLAMTQRLWLVIKSVREERRERQAEVE